MQTILHAGVSIVNETAGSEDNITLVLHGSNLLPQTGNPDQSSVANDAIRVTVGGKVGRLFSSLLHANPL